MEHEVLLGLGPIVGIRWWFVHDESLYGVGNFGIRLMDGRLFYGPRWSPGKPLRAACLSLRSLSLLRWGILESLPAYKLYYSRHPGIDAPQRNCTCGIYAVSSTTSRPEYAAGKGWTGDPVGSFIQGEVLLWGNVIEHDTGWRAQYAQVKAFHEEFRCIQRDLIYRMADIYHVPVLDPPRML